MAYGDDAVATGTFTRPAASRRGFPAAHHLIPNFGLGSQPRSFFRLAHFCQKNRVVVKADVQTVPQAQFEANLFNYQIRTLHPQRKKVW
jgi:hypothetical protein